MIAKRKAGDTLHLVLNIGEPTTGLFARAFLTDPTGANLGTIDLANDGECFSDHTVAMPNLSQVLAKYKVFSDAAYTIEECGIPWAVDQFDLDSLAPSQFAGADAISAKMEPVDISVEMCGKLSAKMEPATLYAKMDAAVLNVTLDDGDLGAVLETDNITADLD